MPGTERPDPYRVLGVARHSSPGEIREAYRRLANESHPDRPGRGSAARMAEINEAYRVLRDPTRRAAHDAGRPARSARAAWAAPAPPGAAEVADVAEPRMVHGPVRMPWRAVAVFAVIGSLAVVVASQVIDAPRDPAPDNILRPGSCVAIQDNGDAREVACTGMSDLVVRSLVGFEEGCPYGTDAHRDRQGMGWACVTRTT